MICPLHTLLPKYQNKKIYVWNINRTSVVLFTKIAFMKIDIQGFVIAEEKFGGETYMNRPVVFWKQVAYDNDTIILVSDDVPRERIFMLSDDQFVYWSDALGLNETLKNECIAVYGMGYGAGQVEALLGEIGKEAELYCVTKREGGARHKGKRVIEASELHYYENYSVIISVQSEGSRKEILETLSDFKGKVYVEHIIDEVAFLHLNLFQYLDLAVKEQREVYLYGRRTNIANLIEEILQIYHIKISGYVYEKEVRELNIRSIYSLGLNGIGQKLLIITEITAENFIRAREAVELAGFSLDAGNYTGFQWYTASDDNLLGKLTEALDPLVGFSILYSDGKPGWKIYGKEKKEDIKIMVLGGSTSSEVYRPENWVSKLYYKLRKQNYSVTIYNGAHTADDVVDELLRLLRDGHALQPQIVISMSGVNNLSRKKSINQFNETRTLSWVHSMSHGKACSAGVANEEMPYSFWCRVQRLLKLTADFYGASFLGFLQPMNITMSIKDLWEKSVYEVENAIIGAWNFVESTHGSDVYINLMQLFEHQEERYIDLAHYTDSAHEIIADKVYEAILPIMHNVRQV